MADAPRLRALAVPSAAHAVNAVHATSAAHRAAHAPAHPPGARSSAARTPAAPPVPGAALGGVRWLLRLEGGVLLLGALAAYAQGGAGWPLLALLFLLPDLAWLGYLAGPRTGAWLYNATHSAIGPLAAIGIGALAAQPLLGAAGLVWLAHVGLDRLCGFGLHYTGAFGRTHLGPLGRPDPW